MQKFYLLQLVLFFSFLDADAFSFYYVKDGVHYLCSSNKMQAEVIGYHGKKTPDLVDSEYKFNFICDDDFDYESYIKKYNERNHDSNNPPSSIYREEGYTILDELTIPSSIHAYTIVQSDNKKTVSRKYAGTYKVIGIASHAYYLGVKIRSLSISDGIEYIGDYAFHRCSHIEKLTLPTKALKSIGNEAFSNCDNLKSVTIPQSVKECGSGIFASCDKLSMADIQCDYVPSAIFYECDSLEKVTLSDKMTTIGSDAFYGCENLKFINPVLRQDNGEKYWENVLPSGIKSIEYAAFMECHSLNTIDLPLYLDSLGHRSGDNNEHYFRGRVFEYCKSLERVTFHKNLKYIGHDSFEGCIALEKVIVDWDEPIECEKSIFGYVKSRNDTTDYIYDNATLFIRNTNHKRYREVSPWKYFKTHSHPGGIDYGDALTLTAKSYTRVYGDSNPTFEFEVTNGSITSGTPTITCSATASSPVGTYDIIITKGTVSNNSVELVNGKLTITNAPLTISAGDYTKKQGEDNPIFTPTFSGFKNNETEKVLIKQPTITTVATKTSPAGSYLVTVNGAEAQNYNISYQNGTLTVTATVPGKEPYAVLSDNNTVVTFYYDTQKSTRGGIDINNKWIPQSGNSPYGTATKAVFDISFASYRPVSTSHWFHKCKLLTAIIGIENLKTNNVTDMSGMFASCSSLTNIDVSSFKTDKVEFMYDMFSGCSSLTSLDLSGFITSNVTLMSSMFYGCTSLTDLDVSSFNTSNVTSMRGMFYNLCALTNLDLSSFMTDKVEDMAYMFHWSSKLETIFVSNGWSTAAVTESIGMFEDCIKIFGGQGTAYSYSHTDHTFAHIDGGLSYPGYLTDIKDKNKIVTLTAKSYTRAYGEDNPFFEYAVTGGTIISGMPKITCSATKKSPVGNYDIVIAKGTVINKNVELVKGTLTITKAPLAVTANSYTIKQGEALPTFEATYSGFKNGETKRVLIKQPTFSCSASPSSEPGTYDIDVSGAEAENYDISFIKGTLTIEAGSFTLTYIVDGKVYKTVSYTYGESIIPESEPTEEGYSFSGWDNIPSTMPGEDVTVTGSFTINDYTLTYLVDGEVYKTVTYSYNCSISSEDEPTKEGYTFSGWSEIPDKMPDHDVTVMGTFRKGTYTLTYVLDGEVYKTVNYAYGESIIPESEPTEKGYTFSGWDNIPSTMPGEDVTVTGSFTINNYTLTDMVDGEVYKTISYDFGDCITPETDPTKDGYTFSGWSEIPQTMPSEDMTVSGTFTVNKYKLTYLVDGEVLKTVFYDYDQLIIPEKEPTKDGYTFSGWNGIPERMPSEDITVTGIFKQLDYNVGDMTYEITSEGTVTIKGGNQKGSVEIAAVIEINGQTYRVTAIAENAFKDNQDITSVIIADGITAIGENAFNGCIKLVVINIGKDVQSIGNKAFANIGTSSGARTRSKQSSIAVNCYAEIIPQTATDAFENTSIETGKLLVIDELVNYYKTTSPWSRFGTIMGFNEAVGINGIYTNSADSRVYNLNGNRVNQPKKGVNIHRDSNGRTHKVVIK